MAERVRALTAGPGVDIESWMWANPATFEQSVRAIAECFRRTANFAPSLSNL